MTLIISATPTEPSEMWIRLENDEITLILKSIPEGELSVKLRQQPDPATAAFVAAVATDDELEVDSDAVISRGDDGAFVMSWVWISNKEAGITVEEPDNAVLSPTP